MQSPTASGKGELRPDIAHLDRAGSLLTASWFTLCGHHVSWPLEPSRYDLLVCTDARIRRVQVKTTTVRAGDSWKVYLSTSHRERRTYDTDEIDDFFIIDGELTCYLIPVVVVGGLHAIHLGGYVKYQLAQVTPAFVRDHTGSRGTHRLLAAAPWPRTERPAGLDDPSDRGGAITRDLSTP
jgi:hypothetical protein